MRALDDLTLIQEYIDTRAQIDALTEREKEIKEILIDALILEDGEKFDHAGCNFSITRRRVWKYDEAVQAELDQMNAHIKDVKTQISDLEKHAQQTKQAEVIGQPAVMVFKAPKAPRAA